MTEQADTLRRDRRHFAWPGGSHDRLVTVLARVLPALIGVIVALMIFTPLAPRGEVSFILDRHKVAIAEDRLRVENAMYRGEDNKGRPFSLTAGEAVQQSARVPVVRMRDLQARILLAEGPAVLSAGSGEYDFETQKVAINGLVQFAAADGYRATARDVSIDLEKRALVGEGRVEGAIPAGTFSADRIVADLGERTIMLDGHARLHMEPGKLRMP
ncbi:MAG TPA: LPS export ABC transporter periplasmic protein LptC [Sphingomonadaceae bacterium]|nr:LPS export ABC transporter periplasmic protein LptC [Sphingomonadaceae bacterium]